LQSALSTPTSLKMNYQVVHAVAGRFRVRIPQLASESEYVSKLSWLIKSLNFVTSVRINPAASSVIVNYDVDVVSSTALVEKVFACIRQASVADDCLETTSQTTPLEEPQVNSWQDLSLPFMSLAVALLAAPLELPPLIVGAVIAGAALPWFSRATDSIVTHHQPNIDLLDSLWMTLQTLQGQYVAPALKTSLVEIRRSFRGTTMHNQEQQALNLLECLQQYAWVEDDGQEQRIPATALQVGDRVIVHAGELIPVDGQIVKGTALIDTYNLTGVAVPVTASEGQDVYASTLVLEGRLSIAAKWTGNNTRAGLVAHIIQSAPVHDTQIGVHQAELVKNAVVPTIFLGGTIFALTGNIGAALSPFQLDFGSGIPISLQTTVLAALTDAARHGVFIRSGRVLEVLAHVDTIIFNKTVTLDRPDYVLLDDTSVISELRAHGINTYMLVDNEQQVDSAVAHQLGSNFNNTHLDGCAQIKADLICGLQRYGKTVAFFGHETSDAAAFTHADVSISFANDSAIAQDSADIVLLDNNLQALTYAVALAQRAMAMIHQNTATIVIPNLIVQIGGGMIWGLDPVVNVIVNNSSALIAEFLHDSQPLLGTSALAASNITAERKQKAGSPVMLAAGIG